MRVRGLAAVVGTVALLTLSAPPPAAAQPPAGADPIKIGMVESLFRDLPPSMITMLMQPFSSLMKSQTGMNGAMVPGGDALALAKQLQQDQVQLGVFHGVEFAWAQEKYPDLKPLVIAVNQKRNLYANLVVRDDSTATSLADLKGKKISLPRRSREHVHLYLRQGCLAQGAEPANFAQLVVHPNIEEGLDDVVRGKVQGIVVDSISLEAYEQLKSGCYARLKVIKTSGIFPAAVIAYRDGALDAATLKQFKDGMVNANKTTRGRELMSMWMLTAFEAIPADFPQTLANVRQAYPTPAAAPVPPVKDGDPAPVKGQGK